MPPVEDAGFAPGFFVVVFVVESVFIVEESVPIVDDVEDVDGVVLEPIVEPEPEPIDESEDDGIAVVDGIGAGVVVDVVDVVVELGSFIVPEVLDVSGVFGGSLPPHATRPAKHAPTNRAENFMRNSRVGGTKPSRPFVFSCGPPTASSASAATGCCETRGTASD